MSRQITQPINQVRLTNVAVVRYTIQGKRYEIACYRNKVLDYRAGLETDLDEVLQTDRIFTNVSKGEFASMTDLKKSFGNRSQSEIAKLILQNGKSLQVSDLERNQQLDSTITQIATWVAHNCVHPTSQRPYTVTQIKQALGKNFQVPTHKAMKAIQLEAVQFLKTILPIERAKMELLIQCPRSSIEEVNDKLRQLGEEHNQSHQIVQTRQDEDTMKLTIQCDPSWYRTLNDLMQQWPSGRLEIVQQVVVAIESDADLELEFQTRNINLHSTPSTNDVYREQDDENDEDDDDEETLQLKKTLKALRSHSPNNGEKLATNKGRSKKSKKKKKKSKLNRISESESDDEDDPKLASNEINHDSESTEEAQDDNVLHDILALQPSLKVQRKAQKKKSKRELRKLDASNKADTEVVIKETAASEQASTHLDSDACLGGNDTAHSEAKSCNTCGGLFATAGLYRAHFRSDWHRFNQKLKMKGLAVVTEEEFTLCDASALLDGGLD